MNLDKTILTVVILFTLLISTIPSSHSVNSKNTNEDTVGIGLTEDIWPINPIDHAPYVSRYIMDQIYQPLIRNNPDGKTNCGGNTIAERYEVLNDGKTITFHLEKGIKFHNGEELTAEDVVFTIKTILGETNLSDAPDTYYSRHLTEIESVSAFDNYTVNLFLNTKDMSMLKSIYFDMNIVPKDYIVENGWDQYEEELIGSGPYELVEYDRNSHISLKKFDDYKGDVNIDNLRFKFFDDEETAVEALKDGDIHYLPDVSLDRWKELKTGSEYVAAKSFSMMGSYFIRFNQDEESSPWSDVRLRKAFAYAIDAEEVIEEYRSSDLAFNTRSPIPGNHHAHEDVKRYERDINRSKKLLKKAGYPDGISSKLYVSEGERYEEMKVVKQQVVDAGFDIELVKVDKHELINDLRWEDYPLSYFGWHGIGGPYSQLKIFNSNCYWHFLAGGYNNASYDSITRNANWNTDSEQSIEAYKKAQKVLVEDDMAMYNMYVYKEARAYHKTLRISDGIWDSYFNHGPLMEVYNWTFEGYRPPEEPRDLEGSAKDDSITLNWNPPADNGSSDLLEYKIYRRTGIDNLSFYKSVDDIVTNYTDRDVNYSQTYRYQISAVNNEGEGNKTDIISVKTPSEPDSVPPEANAGEDLTVDVGEQFTLDASDSSDNEGIVVYEWDLNNGETKTGEEVTYEYKETGTYTVELTVEDEEGNFDTDTVNITVEEKTDDETGDNTSGFTFTVMTFSISFVLIYHYRRKQT
ncbi:MAG: ABC transporter substrate-binding protein [Thermoplasmatota archaeon]